jgi:very-short-patch-repair endonuclease
MKTLRKSTNLQGKNKRKLLRNNSTPQELKLWLYLKNKNLGYKFRRQQGIGNFIVDFCCPAKKLIIEIDGSQHIENEEYDEKRTLYLESLGYKVLRFWNNEINDNIESVVNKIKDFLDNE